jgi:hypothetical protein
MKFIPTLVCASIALSLSACDSGSSGSSKKVSFNETPIAITKENSRSIVGPTATGTQAAGQGARDNSETGKNFINDGGAVSATNNLIYQALGRDMSPTTRALESSKTDCSSGSIKIDFTDLNKNQELDQGDSLLSSFNDCSFKNDQGKEIFNIDGSIAISANALSEEPLNIDISIDIDELTIDAQDEGESKESSIDGDIRLSAQETLNGGNGKSVSLAVSGNKMELNDNEDFVLIKDYDISQSWTEDTKQWTQTLKAVIASTDVDGQVSITTPQELVGTGDNPPSSGKIKFTGANNTSALLDANTGDLDTVYLIVDDGKGNTTTEEVKWDDLDTED